MRTVRSAVAAIDRLRRQTSATVLLLHHTVKNGKWERGSGALRGAADVMIECSRGESNGLVSLECAKMKDAESFPPAKLGLERIVLSPASSSLAVADWKDALEAGGDRQRASQALEVLKNEFSLNGATHGEWAERYMATANQSKSTFNRALAHLKATGAVRQDGKKYYPMRQDGGVRCQEVSERCHDTSHGGVTSPPSQGGDTDTAGQRIETSEVFAPAD